MRKTLEAQDRELTMEVVARLADAAKALEADDSFRVELLLRQALVATGMLRAMASGGTDRRMP